MLTDRAHGQFAGGGETGRLRWSVESICAALIAAFDLVILTWVLSIPA